MKYRPFGDMSVSEIAFGCGDNAGVMVYGTAREQIEIIERALELGVNLFDTSAAYGRGASEVNLGRTLADVKAEDVHVMSKVFLKKRDFDHIAEKVTESIDESLFRLRRERLDVLFFHNPLRFERNPANPLIEPLRPEDVIEKALPALVEARRQGKIRCLGLACDEGQVEAIRPVLETHEFDVINLAYNLVNPSADKPVAGVPEAEDFTGLFELARQADVDVAVVRPIAGGALAGNILEQGAAGIHQLSKGYFRMLDDLRGTLICTAQKYAFLHRPPEQSITDAAYRYILAHPQVATVIGGYSDAGQLSEAVAATAKGRLSDEDLAAIDRLHLG